MLETVQAQFSDKVAPVSLQRLVSCLRLQKTVESPQLQSIVGRRLFPVVAQRQIPMVLFR